MFKTHLIIGKALMTATLLMAGGGESRALELSLPIACTIGEDCFIQQYVDHDAGPGARDYACGSATYDGHKGTDFRVRTLLDAARGVSVLASAPGRVKGIRDGETDILLKTKEQRASVRGKECGNGVVIDHGDGWETQYCHLRRGSVTVKKGQKVRQGDELGLVGYSGDAAFPHVHLSVRKDGKTVDPYRGLAGGADCKAGDAPLWSAQSLTAIGYSPSILLGVGFSDDVKSENVEWGSTQEFIPDTKAPALVAWGWAINLEKGDRIETRLLGPQGEVARNLITLDRNKAQLLRFIGKKRPGDSWPTGRYQATFKVMRGSELVIDAQKTAELR